jgi:dienelactone hydrolase
MEKFVRKDVKFNADGIELKGWFYLPNNGTGKYPAIVMAPGWNSVKEFYLDCYAEEFAKNGFAVLVFDNR